MTANLTQVGGTHYQQGYQHWDMVADFRLGYFPGQVTKYITRHKRKNGRQDVEKAMHFLVKWEELMHANKVGSRDDYPYIHHGTAGIHRYCHENQLGHFESIVIEMCCLTRGRACVPMAKRCIQRILDEQYGSPKVEVTSITDAERKFVEAGPGYVDQDR